MIDVSKLKSIVVSGLKEYLGCEVVRTNQNVKSPSYPYVSYTVTTLASANKGTYEEHDDGTTRKQLTQTWSVSALSDKESESVNLALKAREWFDYAGNVYLKNNNVIVQSVTSVTNRDNVLTVEYEYKNGFDVVFYLFDETENNINKSGVVEYVDLSFNGSATPIKKDTIEEIEKLIDDSGLLD